MAVTLALPFTGRWLVQNSPSARVPSHGVDLYAERYAIDFVAVDEHRRSAPVRDWRTWFATEPAERFSGFGAPVLSPVDGEVTDVHDDEPDHEARRSQLALVRYALGQAGRLRAGIDAVAGNRITIRDDRSGMWVVLVHLKASSPTVRPGERVEVGQPVGACGNSGNSTEPHLHVQVMDAPDAARAGGVPLLFDVFVEEPRRAQARVRHAAVPAQGAVVRPVASRPGGYV